MPIKNAIHSQQVYDPTDESIMAEQELCMERLYDYNHTRPSEHAKRAQLLKEMLAECGAGCWIEPPFHANWGGKHVHMGDYVYANFGLTCVDDTHIYIGEHTMIGPNCVLATANHPILPELREKAYQYNLPIRIGRNCWLGTGVIVVPSVTIGDNTVIGSFMCQGKMPMSVRQRYENMKKQPLHLPNLNAMIENFDKALSHPDADDLERLKQAVK